MKGAWSRGSSQLDDSIHFTSMTSGSILEEESGYTGFTQTAILMVGTPLYHDGAMGPTFCK